jgi:hypothetical protein
MIASSRRAPAALRSSIVGAEAVEEYPNPSAIYDETPCGKYLAALVPRLEY